MWFVVARKSIGLGALVALLAALVPFGMSCSKPPPPDAAFSVTYESGQLIVLKDYIAGTAPLKIRFHDESSGEITNWRWNFGDGVVIDGSDEATRSPVHEYVTPNTGYIVTLTVQGPGGSDQHEEAGVVAVLLCSEAAVSELHQAQIAIEECLTAAGKSRLDSPITGWDGSRGIVVIGGKDAADYLGVWKSFKARYDIQVDGSIILGTDVSWGCVYWDPVGLLSRPGWVDVSVHGVPVSPL